MEALRWMMGDDEEPSPSVDSPLGMLLRSGLVARQEERDGRYVLSSYQGAGFCGPGGEGWIEKDSKSGRLSSMRGEPKSSGNIWDLLRARDYYYRAEEWEKAADIVIAAWEHLSRWGYIELAMRLLKESADTTSGATRAMATGNLAILYHDVGDWKTALRLYGEVKEIFEALGDRRNVAAALDQLGMIHQDQGNYPRQSSSTSRAWIIRRIWATDRA